MVVSQLNNNVNYPEIKRINSEDLQQSSNLYEINISLIGHRTPTPVIAAIGKPNYSFAIKNIVYFPLYLIKTNRKAIQIGVYEIESDKMIDFLDEDGALDLERVAEPLLYNFATYDFVNKLRLKPEKLAAEESPAQKTENPPIVEEKKSANQTRPPPPIPEIRRDIFTVNLSAELLPPLKKETRKIARNIREKYHESVDDLWVQKFMKNPHYGITDNEGGGDCLFATIRDAFATIGQNTTIAALRGRVSTEATSALFEAYRERYNMFDAEIKSTREQSVRLKREYEELKQQLTSMIDTAQLAILREDAKRIKAQYEKIKAENVSAKENIKDVQFMKNMTNLQDLKQYMTTCDFWADIWAINTLERILNIKFMILSSAQYSAGDIDNVLQCGDFVDPAIQERREFNPEFYIIVDHTGDHYKLITYHKYAIFNFGELPYDLKKMVVDKCMERNAGVFTYISDFENFKNNANPLAVGSFTASRFMSHSANNEKLGFGAELGEAKLLNLYDDNIVFSFYEKSADKLKPGKGTGEKIPSSSETEFVALSQIPQWRRKLSDTWIQPFELDGHRWASVVHYMEAAKFKKEHPAFYEQFTLDVGGDLANSVEEARRAGKKSKTSPYPWDKDYEKRKEEEHRNALAAKFEQNEDLKRLLLATKNAKLVEHVRSKDPIIQDELMVLRDKLEREK